MKKVSYPSDLTDDQWRVLEPVLLACRTSRRGCPIGLGRRKVIHALLYVVKTGCQWRQRPQNFGPWMTIYSHFRRMRARGTWERVLHTLRGQARVQTGHHADPSVAIIDLQSVKTVSKGGHAVLMRARKSKAASVILP